METQTHSQFPVRLFLSGLFITLILVFFLSLTLGKYPLSLLEIRGVLSHILFGSSTDYSHSAETVFLQVRFPRLLACLCTGTALSVSGAVYQGIFKNPMVSPDLLGASATLATSASVAACGMVGWIGLVIPHLMRLITGPDYRYLIPASALGGGLFLILVDNITRIFFQVEISIGILTALVGAPCFLFLLVKGRGSWM
ncbi:MAG: iron chelate uptake ABC transporter family permease subunit [Lachnospiraceae bacterium]|nr:iron chelate uptake ABC transporter family permease subunit [Lachnospiraceae bacterium]